MRRKKTRRIPATRGNQHLSASVTVLTAIFIGLGLYTLWYVNRSKTRVPAATRPATRANQTASAQLIPLLDTPLGVRVFVSTIKEVKPTQIIVERTDFRNGKPHKRFILVAISKNTQFYKLAPASPVTALQYVPPEQGKTKIVLSELRPGDFIQVHATQVIDGKTAVTAERIDVLP